MLIERYLQPEEAGAPDEQQPALAKAASGRLPLWRGMFMPCTRRLSCNNRGTGRNRLSVHAGERRCAAGLYRPVPVSAAASSGKGGAGAGLERGSGSRFPGFMPR